jgi:hypothetical protein
MIRRFMKGVIWELLGVVVLYLLTQSLKVGIVYISIRILTFWAFDYLWEKVGEKHERICNKRLRTKTRI